MPIAPDQPPEKPSRKRTNKPIPRARRVKRRKFVPPPNLQEIANPLPGIAKLMGLTTKTAARLAGVAFSAARQAMADKPFGAIDAYNRIAMAMGAHLRLKRAAPICIWIDLGRLDAYYLDNPFRKAHELSALPSSRLQLRRLVRKMRTKWLKSYGEIVAHMERQHICTPDGAVEWRRGNIGHLLKIKKKKRLPNDDNALVPGPTALARWRDLLLGWILTDASGPDAFFRAKYAIEQHIDGGKLWLVSTMQITEMPRKWFMESVAKIPWLNGAWGEATVPVLGLPGISGAGGGQASEKSEQRSEP